MGKINGGFVEPPYWLEVYNADELGRLVAENKISFAFNGGSRENLYTSRVFNNCAGDMFCVVIDGKISLLNNYWHDSDEPDDAKFHLLPLEEYVNQME